jgi:hypothetical protein
VLLQQISSSSDMQNFCLKFHPDVVQRINDYYEEHHEFPMLVSEDFRKGD